MAEYVRLVEANAKSDDAYELVDDAQTALLTAKPTTIAGAAAVLAYVATFWIEGDDSSARGLPVNETLAHDRRTSGRQWLPSHDCRRAPAINSRVIHERALWRAGLFFPLVARSSV